MNASHLEFLRAVLGPDGAQALCKAIDQHASLEAVLLPRAVLAWVGTAGRLGFDGMVPGGTISLVMTKSELGLTGSVGEDQFKDEPAYRVAARVAVAIGLEPAPGDAPRVDLARLGKTIDTLVKTRAIGDLRKKLLDPNEGYKFHTSHVENGVGGLPETTVRVHSAANEHVGYATFNHHPDGSLSCWGVAVEDAHQRKGIASHMYRLAEQATGKKVRPSTVQTDEGAALWAGNAQQGQFGLTKLELPGRTAMPVDQGGPIGPDKASRQQSAAPKPKAAPKPLKMSERQLCAGCSTCGAKPTVVNGKLKACACWSDLARDLKLEKTESGYSLTFGRTWDGEARAAFLADRF